MSKETATSERAPASLPIWVSIPIILLCLAAGGYILHWYTMTDPVSHESTILGNVPVQAQWGGQPRMRPGNGFGGAGNPGGQRLNRPPMMAPRKSVVFDPNSGDLEVRTDKARASAAVTNGKANIRFIFYLNNSFLPVDAHNTILAANALHKNQAVMNAMKLLPADQNRLRMLSANLPMALTAADKKAFSDAAEAYVATQSEHTSPDPKIMQLLDEIADRSVDATKKEALDRAAQINQIVTPDMWKLNASIGGK